MNLKKTPALMVRPSFWRQLKQSWWWHNWYQSSFNYPLKGDASTISLFIINRVLSNNPWVNLWVTIVGYKYEKFTKALNKQISETRFGGWNILTSFWCFSLLFLSVFNSLLHSHRQPSIDPNARVYCIQKILSDVDYIIWVEY